MKALINGTAPGTVHLVDRPRPVPGPDDVLVHTRALALNNSDLAASPEGQIAGYDFSGVIDEVGENIDTALVGRSVLGAAPASFAEYVAAHSRHVLELPEQLAFPDAAPLPTALLTEYGALRRAGVRAGDTVLITAGTSGVALVGTQLARVLGAQTVIATTRSRDRADLLSRTGVDHVVITDEVDLADRVRQLTAGVGADVVLDHVAGGMLATAFDAARTGGSVVSVGRLSGPVAKFNLLRLAARQVTLTSVSFGFDPPSVIGDLLAGVRTDAMEAIADGRVRAIIDSRHAFKDAQVAFDRLRSGEAEGKVVLTLS